ncbi:unnamed protein product [Schistosoma margrebowiei]|uniref:Uncharacterized protein n=1 Tax=Schistosoma margrebowiei TaxID=48269 RepID=A0A183LXB1_9TREM|nr:unnamed protein product [Schistosoma margrebowiei]
MKQEIDNLYIDFLKELHKNVGFFPVNEIVILYYL